MGIYARLANEKRETYLNDSESYLIKNLNEAHGSEPVEGFIWIRQGMNLLLFNHYRIVAVATWQGEYLAMDYKAKVRGMVIWRLLKRRVPLWSAQCAIVKHIKARFEL